MDAMLDPANFFPISYQKWLIFLSDFNIAIMDRKWMFNLAAMQTFLMDKRWIWSRI